MLETKYSEAAVEVLDILNHTAIEDVKLIPQSFIKFLIDISSKNYKVQLNHEQPVNKMDLKKQTRELLGFIYITWWCDKEENKKYKKQIHENIKKETVKDSYKINDIFKNRKENQEHTTLQNKSTIQTSLIEYKKENKFKKFINKILELFKFK